MHNPHTISTSPRGGRPVVENALRLRVRDLRGRFGWAAPDLVASDGTVIRCRIEAGPVTWLHVEHWPSSSAWAMSTYSVSLISSPQPFGGERWRFICPDGFGPCSTLFRPAGARHFSSRQGHGLVFTSQRQRAPVRAAARARRIRLDLGGSADLATPFPLRPKGMWLETYSRYRAEALAVEASPIVR